MAHFLADENFDHRVTDGVIRRNPRFLVTRAQDTEVYHQPDGVVLDWALRQGYVVLTHDVSTMLPCAEQRLAQGTTVPSLVAVQHATIGRAIDDILIIDGTIQPDELANKIFRVPL